MQTITYRILFLLFFSQAINFTLESAEQKNFPVHGNLLLVPFDSIKKIAEQSADKRVDEKLNVQKYDALTYPFLRKIMGDVVSSPALWGGLSGFGLYVFYIQYRKLFGHPTMQDINELKEKNSAVENNIKATQDNVGSANQGIQQVRGDLQKKLTDFTNELAKANTLPEVLRLGKTFESFGINIIEKTKNNEQIRQAAMKLCKERIVDLLNTSPSTTLNEIDNVLPTISQGQEENKEILTFFAYLLENYKNNFDKKKIFQEQQEEELNKKISNVLEKLGPLIEQGRQQRHCLENSLDATQEIGRNMLQLFTSQGFDSVQVNSLLFSKQQTLPSPYNSLPKDFFSFQKNKKKQKEKSKVTVGGVLKLTDLQNWANSQKLSSPLALPWKDSK